MASSISRYLKLAMILGVSGFVGHSRATSLPYPVRTEQGHFRAYLDTSYFSTNANFLSSGGSFSSLGNGRYLRLIDGGVGAEYWLHDRFSIITRFDFVQAESFDGASTRVSTKPTEGLLGGRVYMGPDSFELTIEVIGAYPLTRNDLTNDRPLASEGTMWVLGGFWLTSHLDRVTPYAYAGYRYQDDGRAAHAMWRLGTRLTLDPFEMFLEANGAIVTVSDIDAADRTARDAHLVLVNGSSYKFGSVDPSWLAVKGGASFAFSNTTTLFTTYEQNIDGKNSATGFTALVGLEWNFAPSENSSAPPSVLDSSKDSTHFEPETPAYDPSLFKEEVKPPAKRRGSVTKPPKKKVDIDKSLEDVQKALEK